MNNQEVVSDFRRRYEESFVHVQDPDTKRLDLFYLDSVEDSNTYNAVLNLSSKVLGKIRLTLGSAHQLKFLETPVGVFQNGKYAALCRRIPQKQYRRGLCPANTQLIEVTGSIVGNQQLRFDYTTVANAFNKETFPLPTALEMLNNSVVKSAALRDNYAISLSMTKAKEHVLFFWDSPIARISAEGKTVQVYEKVFADEISSITGGA